MKRQKTQFEQAQEQAAQEATVGADGSLGGMLGGDGGASMQDMQKMMADAFNDPETRATLSEQMGDEFLKVFDQLQNMSPEELERQMQEAMKMLSGDSSMIDGVLEKREEIIEQLEQTKAVPADEIARFKTDPEYFELKMRESFDQMSGLFSDPEYIKTATEALGTLGKAKDMFTGANGDELTKMLKDSLSDDDKLEEARLEVLKGDNPLLTQMFESEEMKAIVNDPVKWRETVKEGYKGLLQEE